jgi:hypothetical protein
MDIQDATRSYEQWMAGQIAVVRRDLVRKHARMAESPFVFLRGTFYRWVQAWPAVCRSLTGAPRVLAVGDLHLENFGTWRDCEGRLVWGVNDVDEACALPYTHDLVRLATSALLATRHGRFGLNGRQICETILDGYRASRDRGGCPLVLAERRRWLRQIALNRLRDPVTYWPKFDALKKAANPIPHTALRSTLPEPRLPYRVMHRVAGVGSLGRPRFVALADWGGGRIAREAKAWLPSAVVWATGRASRATGEALLRRAIRVPDPFFAIRDGWVVRRLAPDCSRIELDDLPRRRDEQKLLRAMGWETANLHLGSRGAGIAADLRTRPRRWLEGAATAMADLVEQEWLDWTRRR